MRERTPSFSFLAVILGIASFYFVLPPLPLGVLLGLLAIGFGVLQVILKQQSALAVAGIVIGSIALVLNVVLLLV